MIQIFLSYKWQILFAAEILGWLVTIVLIFARYYFQSKNIFYISVLGIVVFDYFPSIFLPLVDAIYSKDFHSWFYEGSFIFNLTVLGLFVFGFTIGRKYVVSIDQKIMNFVNEKKMKADRLSKGYKKQKM
jgi:hypothetical protein